MNILNSIAWGLAAAVALLLVGLALLAFRRPILARIGARNIPRRPWQSAFIVVGLTMSTTIFITSLSLGDTLNSSLRRQIVEAYGRIDQVVSPPFLQALLSLSEQGDIDPEAGEADSAIVDLLNGLAEGNLQSILQLLQDGLPGIDYARYQALQQAVADEPLIDGLSGVIFFPTIIRNMDSGQGEPLGAIFAVDASYEEQFGLHDEWGAPVSVGELEPGVGHIAAAASAALNALQARISQVAEASGWGAMDAAQVASAVVTGITLVSQPEGLSFSLNDLAIDTATLKNLGLDTAFLEDEGIEVLSLESLGLTREQLLAFGVDPDAPLTLPSVGDLGGNLLTSSNLFAAFNLNTLAGDVDSALRPYGVQIRQGEVFLSQLGAAQLDAQAGDVLEVFIGPIPLRFRVQAIVKEAGPVAPLIPVIVMDLAEAQQLLFMPERINAALVSNAGDELAGIDNTDAVNRILQAQSFNPESVATVKAALRTPSVAQVIREHASAAEEGPDRVFASGDDPLSAAIANFMGMETGNFRTHLGYLIAYLDAPPAADAPAAEASAQEANLLVALGNGEIRNWLLELPLPSREAESLQAALRNLSDFEVLAMLNKRFALRGVQIAGVAFSSAFWFPGSLSIMAGALLVFLIFVMLAAERRRELGIVRAMGMHRGQVVQMFVTEGMLYDLAASLLGLGLGLLVSYGMLGLVSGFFTGFGQQLSGLDQLFNLRWSVTPASLAIAYCLGVLITGVVVVFASWRVSRMNIVAAVRDLEETTRRASQGRVARAGKGMLGLLLLAGGAGRFWPAMRLWTFDQIPPQAYETLLLGGCALLAHAGLDYVPLSVSARRQWSSALLGWGLLGIWTLPWLRGAVEANAILLLFFLLSGACILIGAILAVMGSANLLARGVGRLGAGIGWLAPAIQLAIAYPLQQRFRTGVAMLLFSMVITSVVVMTQFIQATEGLATPSTEWTAGFDLELTPGLLSAFDPVIDLNAEAEARADFPAADLDVMGSVSHLSLAVRPAAADAVAGTAEIFRVAGLDAGYATQSATAYGFSHRAPDFPTDAAVWQALADRTDVAILADAYVLDVGAARSDVSEAGPDLTDARLVLTNENANAETGYPVQVIGILDEGQTLAESALQVNKGLLDALQGKPVVPSRHFAKLAAAADPEATARALEKSLLSSSLDVSLFSERFNVGRSMARNILRLFRGFFTLGLIVGLAGLAVISSRTVIERRQQIGMLRAIGYQPGSVATVFVLEASFIAASGILIGGAAGVLLGYNLMELVFANVASRTIAVPWPSVAGLLIGTYAMALLAAVLPAWQASRIYPAEALRYE